MLSITTSPAGFDANTAFRGAARAPVRTGRRSDEATPERLLADYLEGWAEADPAKIAEVTAPEYRFEDPLVGTFSTLALPRYFATIRSRSGLGALADREHLAFVLRGPMDASSGHRELEFWREAPRLGLTGTSLIAVGSSGVISERVAYDLNMASDQLRRPTER